MDTSTPVSTGGHDWHSPEYVREWMAGKEAESAERRAEFEMLANCIPYPREAPIRILDVGAGWGPLTSLLLELFPAAEATLLDYSRAMLDEARGYLTRYQDRTRFVVGDLYRPGAFAAAVEAAGGPFDAVVACCCFHNIEPDAHIPRLYRELRGAVAPGGCFLNLDNVGTDGPILADVYHRIRVERRRQRRLAATSTLPSYAEVDAELRARGGGNHEPSARSVGQQLAWLSEVGFDVVECFWREGNDALLGGYVSAAEGATPSS